MNNNSNDEKFVISRLTELPREVLASYICKYLLRDNQDLQKKNEQLAYENNLLKNTHFKPVYVCTQCDAFHIQTNSSCKFSNPNIPQYVAGGSTIFTRVDVHLDNAQYLYCNTFSYSHLLLWGVKCTNCQRWTCPDCWEKATLKTEETHEDGKTPVGLCCKYCCYDVKPPLKKQNPLLEYPITQYEQAVHFAEGESERKKLKK